LKKWHTRFRHIVPSLTVFSWLLTIDFWRKLSSRDVNFLIKLFSVWLSSL
jgi:hypothetical protein